MTKQTIKAQADGRNGQIDFDILIKFFIKSSK